MPLGRGEAPPRPYRLRAGPVRDCPGCCAPGPRRRPGRSLDHGGKLPVVSLPAASTRGAAGVSTEGHPRASICHERKGRRTRVWPTELSGAIAHPGIIAGRVGRVGWVIRIRISRCPGMRRTRGQRVDSIPASTVRRDPEHREGPPAGLGVRPRPGRTGCLGRAYSWSTITRWCGGPDGAAQRGRRHGGRRAGRHGGPGDGPGTRTAPDVTRSGRAVTRRQWCPIVPGVAVPAAGSAVFDADLISRGTSDDRCVPGRCRRVCVEGHHRG